MITASRYVIHKKGENLVFDDNMEVSMEEDSEGYYFSIRDKEGNNVKINFEQVSKFFEAINFFEKKY
jgi:hypothetical protein